MLMQFGEVDPAAKFYVVYSTSNNAYQNWQGELLEFSIKRGSDASRCQIVRLVSKDTEWGGKSSYQLGSDVTFVFTHATDVLADGTNWALLNKPAAFLELTQWWRQHPALDPDAVFVLLDPDMVWYGALRDTDIPPRGTIYGQRWTSPLDVMFPLVLRAGDLEALCASYGRHSVDLYPAHQYHAEMYGFRQAVHDAGLQQRGEDRFGPTAGAEFSSAGYAGSRFLHYCQDFRVAGPAAPGGPAESRSVWFKQSYTPRTRTRPWERPALPSEVEDIAQRYVLEQLHELIRLHGQPGYVPPPVVEIAEGTNPP